MLQLHAGYRDGLLPYAGGLAEQPYKLIQAFSIISARQAHNLEKQAKASRGKKTARHIRNHR